MYCVRCNRIVNGDKCPGCGSRGLRLPRAEDYCFLTEPEPLWVRALEDLLADNGVEYVTRNVFGVAHAKMTGVPERVRFFVRYGQYHQAKELEQAFFSAEFVDFPEGLA